VRVAPVAPLAVIHTTLVKLPHWPLATI